MHNKKLYLVMGLTIFLVSAAAFLGGRMFSRGIGLGSSSGPMGNGRVFISLDDITPAPELPTRIADITGLFIERKDNTVTVQLVSFGAGVGGILGNSPADENSGPKVEVVVTGETTVYRETTEFGRPVSGQDFSVQQTVEESTLDYLDSQSMITVWGRKNGDRVIAEVLLYMNPSMMKKP
ncbi:MAG TPA: hypothetical protein VJM08_12875 [Anaerolineales bacterium]|nr:hypothetical protein [Anaerolineales bacterium]